MAFIEETAHAVAHDLTQTRGGYENSPDLLAHDLQVAAQAANLMSERLGKTINASEFLERTIEFQARITTASQAHLQIVIIVGYVAFFTLWSAMALAIPIEAMLVTGSLMGISLIIFVGWTVAGLIFAKSAMENVLGQYLKGPVGLVERVQAAEIKNIKNRQAIMAWWRHLMVSAGATALLAGVILSAVSANVFVQKALMQSGTPCLREISGTSIHN